MEVDNARTVRQSCRRLPVLRPHGTATPRRYARRVLHAFIDESYIEGSVHLIGALVLTPRQIDQINLGLDDVIWKTNRAHPEVALDIELHGQQLFQRDGEWSCLRDKAAAAFAVYRRSLHTIVQAGGAWFVGGVRRIDRLAGRYVDPWPPHQIALQYTLEMVHDYAEQQGERVSIVADQVPDQAHHEARIRQFQQLGRTPGYAGRSLALIESPFKWEDSRDHRALQAADLLTYVYLRKRFAVTAHSRTKQEIKRLRDVAVGILHRDHVWTP